MRLLIDMCVCECDYINSPQYIYVKKKKRRERVLTDYWGWMVKHWPQHAWRRHHYTMDPVKLSKCYQYYISEEMPSFTQICRKINTHVNIGGVDELQKASPFVRQLRVMVPWIPPSWNSWKLDKTASWNTHCLAMVLGF